MNTKANNEMNWTRTGTETMAQWYQAWWMWYKNLRASSPFFFFDEKPVVPSCWC
jgi:hypothetical protein